MQDHEIGNIALAICLVLLAVHTLGYLMERLRQPRLVGEILAGIILGPFVLGHFFPSLSKQLFEAQQSQVVLNFSYWVGLFLLMFLSGSETRRLLAKENRREICWLFTLGTVFPFLLVVAAGRASLLPLEAITGPNGSAQSSLLILAIAVAVTSIPVISRIFIDLGIIQTRFASLVLAFAVLEDIVLWGVLAVATSSANQAPTGTQLVGSISSNLSLTLGFMLVGLVIAPKVLKLAQMSRWNLLTRASPIGYIFFVLFLYVSVAAKMGVNMVFAAFLAGFGVVGGISGSERARFSPQIESISRVGQGLFIPIYFALVGSKIILGRGFSLPMLLTFITVSSLVATCSFGIAALCAGFRGLDVLNLAITKNARGGPGIVLASVAFNAGMINATFYTTLVLSAVFTSQFAGVWLRFILSRGLPLLSDSEKRPVS